jgi:hypothetical protein
MDAQDIDLLTHSRSPKRRAAAKRLRKLGDPAAGPALLAALQQELKDDRTWETQYQMIMAIGHSRYKQALPFIESLVSRGLEPMVDIAIGDTILRLSRKHDKDADAAVRLLDAGNPNITEGAIQSIAMLRMIPEQPAMQRLIDCGLSLKLGDHDWTVIWLLRAVPGWPEEITKPLLDKWATVTSLQQQHIQRAVDLARKRKYHKWSPL